MSSTSISKAGYCFLSEPDANLFCAICLDLASDPKQCEHCGKLFCSNCVSRNRRKPCAHCRTAHAKYFKDIRAQRDVEDLPVQCDNYERGCQWTGTVGRLDDHTASCLEAMVPCPNKCGEDKDSGELLLIRKDLDEHLETKCPKRAYECVLCGENGTFASITERHSIVCEKKIVACPNKGSGCSQSMEQGEVEEHVRVDCEYTEVACAYESLGCGVKMLRKDRETHENEARRKHLDLSLSAVKLLSEQHSTLSEQHKKLSDTVCLQLDQHKKLSGQHEKLSKQHDRLSEQHKKLSERHATLLKSIALKDEKNEKLSETVEFLSEQHKMLLQSRSVVLEVPGYACKKEKNRRFYSLPFYTHPGGYKVCLCLKANGFNDGAGTHVSASVKLLQGRYDSQLHWPFLGTVTIELLNQLEDDNHHSLEMEVNACSDIRLGGTIGETTFVPHTSLGHNPATNTQYLVDDALYFRVSVKVDLDEPWLFCSNCYESGMTSDSQVLKNGEPVTFCFTQYSWKRKKVRVFQKDFYASPGGYHMCVDVDASEDKDKGGKHVYVFTELSEGYYDSQLHWPFIGTVTVELLNQLSDDNHYGIVKTFDASYDVRVGSRKGLSMFLPHSFLGRNPVTNTQYLLNDVLYFRLSVKVDNHKPWLVCADNL